MGGTVTAPQLWDTAGREVTAWATDGSPVWGDAGENPGGPDPSTPAPSTLIGWGSSSMWYCAPLLSGYTLWDTYVSKGVSGATIEEVSARMGVTALDGVAPPSTIEMEMFKTSATLLWAGKNNQRDEGAVSKIVSMTDAMYDFLIPPRHALVLGHFRDWGSTASGTGDVIDAVNADHAAKYGDEFIDVNGYIASERVWLDTAITPTAEDLDYQALREIPPTLSRNSGHLTDAAYAAVIRVCVVRMQELGWY